MSLLSSTKLSNKSMYIYIRVTIIFEIEVNNDIGRVKKGSQLII